MEMLTGIFIGIVSTFVLSVVISLFMTYYVDKGIEKMKNKDLDINFDEQDIY